MEVAANYRASDVWEWTTPTPPPPPPPPGVQHEWLDEMDDLTASETCTLLNLSIQTGITYHSSLALEHPLQSDVHIYTSKMIPLMPYSVRVSFLSLDASSFPLSVTSLPLSASSLSTPQPSPSMPPLSNKAHDTGLNHFSMHSMVVTPNCYTFCSGHLRTNYTEHITGDNIASAYQHANKAAGGHQTWLQLLPLTHHASS